MLVPRRFDQEGLRAYLDELRPRFLVVRVRVKQRTFTWGFPLSALEEIVGFTLGAAAFAQAATRWLPAPWQAAMQGASNALLKALRLNAGAGTTSTDATDHDDAPATSSASPWPLLSPSPSSSPAFSPSFSPPRSPSPSPVDALWATANDLAGGALRDVIRVPPGEPYVSVRSGRALIDVVAY